MIYIVNYYSNSYPSVTSPAGVSCVPPVALVVGGYNKAWDHEEVFISDAEIYSMVGICQIS